MSTVAPAQLVLWTERVNCMCGETCVRWAAAEEDGRPKECAGELTEEDIPDNDGSWSWLHLCERHAH